MKMNGKLVELEIGKVMPTKENPRAIDEKAADIAELAESIKETGLLVPVLVRPDPKKKGFYDLRAGARRLMAHRRLGLKTIRAIVMDMDDTAARSATVLENLQRENLAPLEEAAAVKMLLAGRSTREVAKKIGKSHQWVARRARVADLIGNWKAAAKKYEIPIRILDQVAAYDAKIQEVMLDACGKYAMEDGPGAIEREIETVTQEFRLLAEAPWKTEQARMAKCNLCKNRTAAKADLFSEDRCLDPECWKKTAEETLAFREAALRKEHPGLVKVQQGYQDKTALQDYKFEIVKKNTPGAKPAMKVDGKNAGELQWIKLHECVSAPKPAGPKTLKVKQGELYRKRWAETVRRFKEILEKTAITALVGKPVETALMLAATFGSQPLSAGWRDWENTLKKTAKEPDKVAAAAEMLWEETRVVLGADLSYYGPVTQFPDREIEAAKKAAKMVNFDLTKLFDAVSKDKGFTEPKAWDVEK